jgi:hypothetical protein
VFPGINFVRVFEFDLQSKGISILVFSYMSLYQLEIARYVFHRHKRDNKSANDVSASSPSLPKIRIPKCGLSSSFKINTDAVVLSFIRASAKQETDNLELEKIYCLLSLKIDVTSYSGPLAEDR